MTGREDGAGTGRAGRAGACARAGLFASLGTVLATFGHHAIAETAVPWRTVGVLIVVQFAAVWPLARRRYVPAASVAVTLAVQGVLHIALSYTDGDSPAAVPKHAVHAGDVVAAPSDGHAWHHAQVPMLIVHTVTALLVAWLLCRGRAGDGRTRHATHVGQSRRGHTGPVAPAIGRRPQVGPARGARAAKRRIHVRGGTRVGGSTEALGGAQGPTAAQAPPVPTRPRHCKAESSRSSARSSPVSHSTRPTTVPVGVSYSPVLSP